MTHAIIDEKFSIEMGPMGRYLRVRGELPAGFHGEREGDGYNCPLDAQNAAAIRHELPWSAPQRVGLRKSFGLGDRLGIATPGHLRAIREGDMFPVLAQQSIREMQRARRSAQAVMDDATWGVLQTDYRAGWGCDADHLKTIEAVDACVEAGFVGFTLDPGEFVDDEANDADMSALADKVAALPWGVLRSDPDTHRGEYTGQHNFRVSDYLRAAAKYGRAIAHVVTLTERIREKMASQSFDLEISVDETATVTTVSEHRYIVHELRRLHVPFTALAPRYPGRFEKGVDFIGDLREFEEAYREHAALAQQLGPYKLSLHSGSDKFSVFPIVAKYSNPYVHIKTSGTSWLEALRVIAGCAPQTFRQILALAIEGYPQNRASYHVSADPTRIPPDVSSVSLPLLLDQFDAREVLHVAFGPVLAEFYDDVYRILYANYELYSKALHAHFRRHIAPFKE